MINHPFPTAEEAVMFVPTTANRGLARVGDEIDGVGVVLRVSDTAYEVEAFDRVGGVACRRIRWVSFDAVHGRPAPVMPLVVLA